MQTASYIILAHVHLHSGHTFRALYSLQFGGSTNVYTAISETENHLLLKKQMNTRTGVTLDGII